MTAGEDLLLNARQHFAFLISFQVFTAIIYCTRTALVWNRPLRLPDKISNALYAIACASNIGNIGGLVYKCSKEIAVRERLRDVERGGDSGGLTREELEVELDRLLMSPYWLKVVFVIAFFYTVELWILKYAFVSFYWSLFSRVKTRLQYLLYATFAIITATFLTIVPLYLCWCLPIERNWSEDLADYAQCAWNPSKQANTILASFNILTDVAIISLPFTIITSLHLNRPEKLALIFVFCIGAFSITASVIRFSAVIRALSAGSYTLMTLRELERWSIVEYTMGLLAFCLPALRGWFVRLIGVRQGSTGRSGDQFADATIGSGPSSALKGLDAAKKKETVWEDYSNVGDRMWDGASEEAICAMARRQTPRTMEDGEGEWEMMVMGAPGNGGEMQRLNSMEPAHRGV